MANAFGTAVITVTVTDGGLDNDLGTAGDNATFQRTFTVTVNAGQRRADARCDRRSATIDEDAALQTVNLAGITAGAERSRPDRSRLPRRADNTGLDTEPGRDLHVAERDRIA